MVNRIKILFSIIFLIPTFSSSAAPRVTQVEGKPIARIGVQDGFYRNRPVIGQFHSAGQGLMVIPPYMDQHDFPYQHRPYEKEVPFADKLNMVRFLGGWPSNQLNSEVPVDKIGDADIFFLDSNGELQFRSELVRKRLDPYVSMGYHDLTIVLDNIPWSLPQTPQEPNGENYGQVTPPANPDHWQQGVYMVANEINRQYPELREGLGFRVGTEAQGITRFNGTQQQYHQHYEDAYYGVKKALGETTFSPFNISIFHDVVENKDKLHNVSAIELAHFTTNGPFTRDKVDRLPWDVLSSSFYFIGSRLEDGTLGNMNPRVKSNEWLKSYQAVHKALGEPADLSWEIHEFGTILDANKLPEYWSGARVGAQLMLAMMYLYEGGVDQFYMWDTFEDVQPGKGEKYLLNSLGWLLTVLDHSRGGDLFSLDTWLPESQREYGVDHHAWAVTKDNKIYVYAVAFDEERTHRDRVTFNISLPHSLFAIPDKAVVQEARLTRTTSVYDQIRDDLDKEGLLQNRYIGHPDTIGWLQHIATMPGRNYVAERFDHYAAQVVDSLTLQPFKGRLSRDKKIDRLVFDVTSPAVCVFVIDTEGDTNE